MSEKIQKFRDVTGLERMVEIDGEQSTLLVQATFNARNGQFKIDTKITTKQVSRSKEVNQATVKQIGQMLLDAMYAAQAHRDAWLSENGEDLGPNLFDTEDNLDSQDVQEPDGGSDDEELSVGIPTPGSRAKK